MSYKAFEIFNGQYIIFLEDILVFVYMSDWIKYRFWLNLVETLLGRIDIVSQAKFVTLPLMLVVVMRCVFPKNTKYGHHAVLVNSIVT